MEQLLNLCASIIEATNTTAPTMLTNSITVARHSRKVIIDSNDAILTVTRVRGYGGIYTETTVNLKQYTDRPPVEVIEELTNIALKEWSECNSEYLIDNKIKQLLKK